ncbi:4-hydroxy-tetrahydrodipicolinate synthase [Marinoscillum sp. MHG1-6]|uniref:4-hydroxy-tetrahydrodipicolinate synthase n=1 Tax=Marinoscillum sp. MHG1-6 TaxID=2959627 RepID=UPI0021582265|nr:4-hydroxy-tetrahydrodipicolinate synthase [Marinoscillum sp. MHG1-6]
MINERLTGTGVALVTPFNEKLEVDYAALKKLLEHISNGEAEYLVILGTTGESATIAPEERFKIIEFVVENNPKQLPLVLGYGSNNTTTIKSALQQFKDYPFDALLSVSPYYNRPSQKGIIRHYQEIADVSPFPVILYNVPPRTGSNLEAATTIELAKHPRIIGTKEAAGDLVQCSEIIANTDDDFLMISGEDALTLPMISLGGNGAISVIANLQPFEFSEMVRLALKGDYKGASKLHFALLEGYELVSAEGNPVSLKTGLEAANIMNRRVRMPLFEGSDDLKNRFIDYLK